MHANTDSQTATKHVTADVQADSIRLEADGVVRDSDGPPTAGGPSAYGLLSYRASYRFPITALPFSVNLTAAPIGHGGSTAAWGVRTATLDVMAPHRPIAQVRFVLRPSRL